MTGKQAPRFDVTRTRPSATIALAILACVHPALAATGTDARCDQSLDARPMSPSDETELAIEIVDHGTAIALAADALSLDEPDTVVIPGAAGALLRPRVELVLREKLDQSVAHTPLPSKSGEVVDRGMPLAVEKTENEDRPSPVVEAEPAETTAELPGLSRDDLIRYRQQMYRRDI